MLKHSCIFNPPKWEVFNLLPKTNVRYSVVFNQKRDFQQSVEKLTEVPNYSKMSSCCIVDNSVYSMNSKNMDIIFFDGSECCSCLSLRLFFHKQLLMKKSNSLLVFLSKFQKGGIYKLQNTCMYIKCMDGLKWALFYDLFEFLVKSSGKSIMGALFYIQFVCKDLIFKELCFLQSINKNPTHFSLIRTNNFQARKTKGSETIGILSKRQFGIKVCSEYKFKVAKREVLAKKRKLIDADPVHKCKFSKYNQKFSQKICCRCKENKWQFFKSLVKCATRNYTDILEAKGILNELETTLTNSMDTSTCSNTILKVVTAGVMETNLIPVPSIETTVTLSNLTKVPLMWKPYHTVLETINEVGTIMENVRNENVHHNAPDKCMNEENTKPKNDILQDSFDDLGNIQSIYSEHISDNTDHKKSAIKQGNVNSLKIFSEKTKCYEKNDSFVTFQTANGKPLNISEKALQTAQKMYREVCSQVINTAKNEQNSSFENLQEKVKDYNYKHDSVFPCAFKSNLSKEYFDNIDNALVDKFFEEIPFDEKVDCKPYSQPGQPSLVQSNTSYKSQSGKVRKSLGGRRSLKPYIKKLS